MRKDLRHFQLSPAAVENRGLQGPVCQIRRGCKTDASGVVDLIAIRHAGGEIHQISRTIRILHDPGVAHGTIMPAAGVIHLIQRGIRACQVEAQPITHTVPSFQIIADCMSDALDHPVFGLAGPGIEIMPSAIVSAQGRPGPSGLVVPGWRGGGRQGCRMLRPGNQVVADGMSLCHIPVSEVRIADGFGRLEIPAVPFRTIMQVPAVPHPFILKLQHLYPFTPVDAIDAMKARCKTR